MQTRFQYDGSVDGWLLTGILPHEQAYLQTFPALTGPDAALNRSLRAKTRENWKKTRATGRSIEVTSLPKPYFGVPESLIEERSKLPIGDPLAWMSGHEYVAWKLNLMPANADRVLFLGCGGGGEIAAFRFLGRTAKVEAVDFCQLFADESATVFGFDFTAQHWVDYLDDHPGRYDAVFSNHCLEHVYNDPATVLKKVAASLRTGGTFAFALPLEASRSNPFMPLYDRIMRSPAAYATMLDAVDCGHPWKTDLPEIADLLDSAGFVSPKFYFRERGASFHAYNRPLFAKRPSYGSLYERPRAMDDTGLAHDARRSPRELALKALYGAKSVTRVNQLKSLRVHEALIIATKA